MPEYKAPIKDFEFLIDNVLEIDQYKDLACFTDFKSDKIISTLEQVSKFAEDVILPLNQSGDRDGAKFVKGEANFPKGFKEAYKKYVKSGFGKLSIDKDFGGKDFPSIINSPVLEILSAANFSFALATTATRNVFDIIYKYADNKTKKLFLPKLADSSWSGALCVSESQCGSDLSLISTKATSQKGGTYNISGEKVFVSAGDHDLSDNIIYLVLARLPDAPTGIKGLSLFLVPKNKIKSNSSLKGENKVECEAIEDKMGTKALPTCSVKYNGSEAYLVGNKNQGFEIIYDAMNNSNLSVGAQSVGISEVAYQNAVTYAKKRLQGRSLKGAKNPEKKADPLIVHPDIRRMLLVNKSFSEGARALSLYTSLMIDVQKHSKNEKQIQDASDFISFITPIIKASFSDFSFESTNLALQIYGSYGYLAEQGIEQYVRDIRAAQIYDGANGVQALDLAVRRLPKHMGRYLRSFFHKAQEFVDSNKDDENFSDFNKNFYQSLNTAKQASLWVAANGLANPDEAAGVSVEYLRLLGLVTIGFMWVKIARVCLDKINEGSGPKDFYESKLATARFYTKKVLPQTYSLLASIANGTSSMVKYEDRWF